jgi:hypothetical protein
VKLDLGSLFQDMPHEEVVSIPEGEEPLSKKKVAVWSGERISVRTIIRDRMDCAPGLRKTGAILDMEYNGSMAKALVWVQDGKLCPTQGMVLLKKAPSLLKALRERTDAEKIHVYITNRTSAAGRRYMDFVTELAPESEHPQGNHTIIVGVCMSASDICASSQPFGALGCTRKKGHSGLHHGAGEKYCYGSWA